MKNKSLVQPLNRRAFIATTSAVTLSGALAMADDKRVTPDLSGEIHPDVQIQRDELSRESNAFWIWADAAEKLTPLDEFAESYFEKGNFDGDLFEFQNAVSKAESPLERFPDGKARECVLAWLESSRESLELINRGIAKHRYQIPQEHLAQFPNATNGVDEMAIPRHVARLKSVMCSFYLTTGKNTLAAKMASELLEMARMMLSGDGYLVHYLVAMGIHRRAIDAAIAVVFHPNTHCDSIRDIRQALLDSRPIAKSLARTYRVEVVYFTQREVALVPQTNDLRRVVDDVLEKHLKINGEIFDNDEEVRRVRRGMLKLFEGHPQPFDPAETVRIHSGIVATMLSDIESSWLNRKKNLARKWLREVKPWPQPLWFISALTFMLYGNDAKEDRNVSKEELAKARKALLRVHNPIGKLMMHYLDGFESVRQAFHVGQLQTDVGLVMVACRLFEGEKKRLPQKLSELVESHLLDSIPMDPFSGKVIQYDVNRRILWSFGYDEKDNGGDWDFEAEIPEGDDLVWRLPREIDDSR